MPIKEARAPGPGPGPKHGAGTGPEPRGVPIFRTGPGLGTLPLYCHSAAASFIVFWPIVFEQLAPSAVNSNSFSSFPGFMEMHTILCTCIHR